ncbi:MAG TPA: alpha/beta hydrolase [Trueperaceae bacterium]|nr:alpha/beta hydrolase [Trueperaceae bacterium]
MIGSDDSTPDQGPREMALSLEVLDEQDRPQARLYFERVGPADAATVYYLHGGPGYNTSSFRELMGDELTAYDMIYADARGGGRSPGVMGSDVDVLAGDVEAVLGALEVDSVVLLAHGFGALVAAQVAANDPVMVRRLVLVNPWLSMPRLAQDLNTAARRLSGDEGADAEAAGDEAGDGPSSDPTALVDEAFALANPKVLFDSLQFRTPAARLRLEHVDAVALAGEVPDEVDRLVWELDRLDALAAAAAAGVEVVVISGAHDGTSYPAQAELALKRSPNALFSLLEGGHYPWIDDEEAFALVLSEALGPASSTG